MKSGATFTGKVDVIITTTLKHKDLVVRFRVQLYLKDIPRKYRPKAIRWGKVSSYAQCLKKWREVNETK